jgi:hypothetical protein
MQPCTNVPGLVTGECGLWMRLVEGDATRQFHLRRRIELPLRAMHLRGSETQACERGFEISPLHWSGRSSVGVRVVEDFGECLEGFLADFERWASLGRWVAG